MEISIEQLQAFCTDTGIDILTFRDDMKSSEKYVDIIVTFEDNNTWEGSVPYYYRRTGLFIEKPTELFEYLVSIKQFLLKDNIKKFKKAEKKYWKDNFNKSDVTSNFFKQLSKMKWTSSFPQNDNPQRRIQAIKEKGYTIATRRNGKKAERLLLPIPRGPVSGYETFSAKFRSKALKILDEINVYEVSSANKHGLLPDHKFPEIRWDEATRKENPDSMSEKDIRNKFQLLDNQRNQQKREVCRKCFQTDTRGKLFGVNYYYEGTDKWDNNIPKVGEDAEKGCVGCGWYDIQQWRNSLNKKLLKS